MNVTDAGIAFIRSWEGERLYAYKDAAGLLTIGVGHLLTSAELKSKALAIGGDIVYWENRITSEQSATLLKQDLKRFEKRIDKLFRDRALEPHEFDALAALAFNIGEDAFAGSTAVSRLLGGNRAKGLEAWSWWNKATVNGVRVLVDGLAKRRKAEIALFDQADYSGRP